MAHRSNLDRLKAFLRTGFSQGFGKERVNGLMDVIEKGLQCRVPQALGAVAAIGCDQIQEGQDLVSGDRGYGPVMEKHLEPAH